MTYCSACHASGPLNFLAGASSAEILILRTTSTVEAAGHDVAGLDIAAILRELTAAASAAPSSPANGEPWAGFMALERGETAAQRVELSVVRSDTPAYPYYSAPAPLYDYVFTPPADVAIAAGRVSLHQAVQRFRILVRSGSTPNALATSEWFAGNATAAAVTLPPTDQAVNLSLELEVPGKGVLASNAEFFTIDRRLPVITRIADSDSYRMIGTFSVEGTSLGGLRYSATRDDASSVDCATSSLGGEWVTPAAVLISCGLQGRPRHPDVGAHERTPRPHRPQWQDGQRMA